jgi:hypothetical protein
MLGGERTRGLVQKRQLPFLARNAGWCETDEPAQAARRCA